MISNQIYTKYPMFPEELPYSPLLATYSERPAKVTSAVSTQNNSMIVRRVATRGNRRLNVEFNLTYKQLEIFEKFCTETLNQCSKIFRFVHPRTLSIIDVSFDPNNDPPYEVKPNGSNKNWDVTFTLIIWS